MEKSFNFIGSGKLLFGRGKFSEISTLTELSNCLLLCGHSFLKTHQYKIMDNLVKFQFIISGEPDPESVDRITSEVKNKITAVIAIGGGSVLDAGKAVAAMCCAEGSVEDYLEGVGTLVATGKTLPVIAVPTTAGTGSEATKNAVICRRGKSGYKKSLRHDNYIPPFIIMDPELYINCPLPIMSSCGMDAFCQLLESYISTKATDFTNLLAWNGLTIFIEYFLNLCKGISKNTETMGKIAFAAYLSGITLANAGLGTVHGIAGPMGGFFDIPHGTACGTLLPEVLKKTIDRLYSENPGEHLNKLEKLGTYIINHHKTKAQKKPAYAVYDLINKWLIELEIPGLSQFGITESDGEKIALASGNKNNPVQFSTEEIREIINRSL